MMRGNILKQFEIRLEFLSNRINLTMNNVQLENKLDTTTKLQHVFEI